MILTRSSPGRRLWLPWCAAMLLTVVGGRGFAADAVEDLRAGRFYHGGTRVRVPLLGVSFEVPRHWRVRLPAGSEVLHLDSDRLSGLGLVIVLDRTDVGELEARLSEPLALEEAYVLDPSEPVRREGSRLEASYRHGDRVGRAVALVGPAGQGLLYVVVGPAQSAGSYDAVLAELAGSTTFLSRETMTRLEAWYDRLMGRRLGRSADAESSVWHLCSDGTFLYEFRRDGGMGEEAGGFDESGTWRVDLRDETPRLILTLPHALPRERRLGLEGESVTIDGKVFERTVSNRCF